MTLATKSSNGKYRINKKEAFCELLEGNLPARNKPFSQLISEFDEELLRQYPDITREARANAHGDWYEWLLAINAWNYHVEHSDSFLAILLPNKSQFDVAQLYKEELYNLIVDLREKVIEATDVRLITSNPDFVILDLKNINVDEVSFQPIENATIDSLTGIEKAYQYFQGKCAFEDIIGYASVKLSVRPDRRLQIPHEGSLMKAIYTHLQTRKWIIHPKGLKYYAISAKFTDADKDALKTVATHSITTVFSVPQAAVDEIFVINSLNQCTDVYGQILV